MIPTLALATTLLARCAPNVGPVTMSALVIHESGGSPYAIGDNSARRSYFPNSAASATEIARTLIKRGHDVDLGYAQINAFNLAWYGIGVPEAFDPRTNLATGARILAAAYAGARHRFGPGQVALAHALSAYNGGGYYASMRYAHGVYATARRLRDRTRVMRHTVRAR